MCCNYRHLTGGIAQWCHSPSLFQRLPYVDEPRRELDGVSPHGRAVLPHEHRLVLGGLGPHHGEYAHAVSGGVIAPKMFTLSSIR